MRDMQEWLVYYSLHACLLHAGVARRLMRSMQVWLVRSLHAEGERQIVSLGDSRIECVRGRLAILSMLTVRVVDLEYS